MDKTTVELCICIIGLEVVDRTRYFIGIPLHDSDTFVFKDSGPDLPCGVPVLS